MALPLYRQAQAVKPGRDAHRGLWWSRFFDRFATDFGKPGEGEKGVFLNEICKVLCGDGAMLSMSAGRHAALARMSGGESRSFVGQGRFTTGLGNDHPTENGFTWHPILGVPYLPASSVKGLVRGWIEWNGSTHEHFADLNNWMGSQTKGEVSEQAGWFIFFDALPTEPVQLAVDVMTPHYGKWYENGGGSSPLAPDTVPADWHSPVPVPFLTVRSITLQFGVGLRSGLPDDSSSQARDALPGVLTVLRDALEWAGAGAKTATGYGRFLPDPEEEKQRQRELEVLLAQEQHASEQRAREAAARMEAERLAALSPVDRKLEVELGKPAYKGLPPWQAWVNTLNVSGLWEPDELLELARRIKSAMQAEGQWVPAEKSKKGERCRRVQQLLGESGT